YTRAGGWAGIRRLDIPKLSVVLGLTTLVVGSTLGVTVQVLLATGNVLPTSFDLIGAHATAQTGGYLVLVAAGFAEWQLAGAAGKRSTLGLAQVYLLFVSGLVLAVSLLLASFLGPQLAPALPGVATLLTLAGIVIVAARFARTAIAAPWMAATAPRHVAVAVGLLALAGLLPASPWPPFAPARGDI